MHINSADFLCSNTDITKCPPANKPEYAFIGRSNVGKSSLINMLVQRKGLAKTSGRPGKTQLINHFLVNEEWYLTDLPGYGFAKVSKGARETFTKFINDYILERENLVNLFVLIDCRLEPQKIDLDFMNWLGDCGIPFSMVFTKADKLGKQKLKDNVSAYMNKMLQFWAEAPVHFISSAEDTTGRDEILDYIETINSSLKES